MDTPSPPRLMRPARPAIAAALLAVLAALLAVAGCDSGGDPPPPEPPKNSAPTARLSADAEAPMVGETVTFDASASSDSDGTIASYHWSLTAPAESEATLNASGDEATLAADVAGNYTVSVDVTDNDGDTDAAEMDVAFVAAPPAMVSLDVTVEPSETETAITDPGGDVQTETGSFAIDVLKLAGVRTLSFSAEGFVSETTEIPADRDQTLSIALEAEEAAPECSDGVTNDGDDLVDADDPGCLSPDGVYEPEDDNEEHRVRTHTYFGTGIGGKYFVSSDPEHWVGIANSKKILESSIQVAVDFYVTVDVEISADQNGEVFTRRLKCGPSHENPVNVNYFDLVSDDPANDGWITAELTGMDRSWFEGGTRCTFRWLHEAFVNDDPGDGDDDVVFGAPDRLGVNVLAWIYDPDNVPGGEATSNAPAPSVDTPDGNTAVTVDVVPDWWEDRR